MRTTIDIDDRLLRKAMKESGLRTKRQTVEAGLQLLVNTYTGSVRERLRSKVHCESIQKLRRQGGPWP